MFTSSAIRSIEPRPLQEGGIPFWVAGGGEQVTLKIAAQYARYTNFNGGVGSYDLFNHIRTTGAAPDIGAIEADAEYLLVNGFD